MQHRLSRDLLLITAFILLSMERGSQEEENESKTKSVCWIEREICGYTVDVLYHKCPESSKNYRKINILSQKFQKILTYASGCLLSNETTPIEIGSFVCGLQHRNICCIYATSCNHGIPRCSTAIPIYVACIDIHTVHMLHDSRSVTAWCCIYAT